MKTELKLENTGSCWKCAPNYCQDASEIANLRRDSPHLVDEPRVIQIHVKLRDTRYHAKLRLAIDPSLSLT